VDQQPQRFCRLDASQPREAVWTAVEQVIRERGWLA